MQEAKARLDGLLQVGQADQGASSPTNAVSPITEAQIAEPILEGEKDSNDAQASVDHAHEEGLPVPKRIVVDLDSD